jgi:hypothetical protein
MVLTVSFVISPVIGLVCHRRLVEFPQGLMPASRHQDHTTSPSATAPLVLRRHQRPSHPAFHVRDDASAPPDERGTELALLLFLPNEKAKYFSQEGWTRRANQCRRVTCDICTVMTGA